MAGSGEPAERGEAPPSPPPVVGIGASAGGLAALKEFFAEIPADAGIAFVVVLHLAPDHESHLPAVLRDQTPLPVTQVTERTRLCGDHVYVIPPDRVLEVTDGHLDVRPFDEPRGQRAAVDAFFRTLAWAHPDGVGVILSGAGTDGTVGMKAIKEAGGVLLAQDPDEAEYDGMPRSAIATGLVDLILPARLLGTRVVELKRKGPVFDPTSAQPLSAEDGQAVHTILGLLHARTGHDFTGYKKSTVLRRIARRMQVRRASTLRAYVTDLRDHGPEAEDLLKDLLISVTSFFRDPAAFAELERRVMPALVADRPEAVRVWVPGCATGEEAYGLAMLLVEAEEEAGVPTDIQVFASDLDKDALDHAREGIYPEAVLADVGEMRARRFFTRGGGYARVSKELRERVLFAHHDVLRDPPFSRLDMVACRNLLIYLERDLQDRLLGIFRYALRPEGYLFLGSSESVTPGLGFRALDKTHRIYQRSGVPTATGDRLPTLPLYGTAGPAPQREGAVPARQPQAPVASGMHREALEEHAPPSVLVDSEHGILHSSPGAQRYLQFPDGTPSANILRAARSELRLELRGCLFQALDHGTPCCSRWIPVRLDGERRIVQIYAAPAPAHGAGEAATALVLFLEFPAEENADLVQSSTDPSRRLEDAESELHGARVRLQEMVEASEAREEELRASNEELQSVNEEYKSTLEELETSKEELQSMNEELNTVNAELSIKLEELAASNDDLRNLMEATEVATLFLDRSLRIKRYTTSLTKLFNVRPGDEGRPVHHVTHNLDYAQLEQDAADVLETLRPCEREVLDAKGGAWLARVTPYRTDEDRIGGVVATFTDVSRLRHAQDVLRASEARFRALVDASAEIVWTCGPDGSVCEDSPSWRSFTGQTERERTGWGWLQAIHPEDRKEAEDGWRGAVRDLKPLETEFRLYHAASEDYRFTMMRLVPVFDEGQKVREWVAMNSDVTARHDAEDSLRRAIAAAERAAEAKSQFLATMSHELRTPLTAIIGLAELLETQVVGPTNHKQQEHLARVKTSAWHLVSIIEEVLTFSRSEAGRIVVHRSTANLTAISQGVVEVLDVAARAAGLELVLTDTGQPEYVFSDANKLRQILTNLVGNAIKFTEQGRIRVEVIGRPSEVEVVVQDSGPGIAAEHLEAVFEPFFQVDNSMTREKGGTGLGLAVSRRLARSLGGELGLESVVGDGCLFRLRVPREVTAELEAGRAGR